MTNLDKVLELPTASEFTAIVCRILDIYTDKQHSLVYPKKFSEIQNRYNKSNVLSYDLKIAEVLIGEKYVITKDENKCDSKTKIESSLIFENDKYINLKKKFSTCFECCLSIFSNLSNKTIFINQSSKQDGIKNYLDYFLVPQIAMLLRGYSNLNTFDYGIKETLPEYSPIRHIITLLSTISEKKVNINGNTVNTYKTYLKQQLKHFIKDFPDIQYPSWDQFINNINKDSTLKINKIDSSMKLLVKEYFIAKKFEESHQSSISLIYSAFYAIGVMLRFEQCLKTMGISVSDCYSKINDMLKCEDKCNHIENSVLSINRNLIKRMLIIVESERNADVIYKGDYYLKNYEVDYDYYINSNLTHVEEFNLLSGLLGYGSIFELSVNMNEEIQSFLKNGLTEVTCRFDFERLTEIYNQERDKHHLLDGWMPILFEAYTLFFESQKEQALAKLKSIQSRPEIKYFARIKSDIIFLQLGLLLSDKLPRNNHYEKELLEYIQATPEYTDIRPILDSHSHLSLCDLIALVSVDLSREPQNNEFLNYHTDKYQINQLIAEYNRLCFKFDLEYKMYVNPVTCIERHLKAILVHLAALFGIKYNHQIPLEIFLIQLKNTVINKLSICDSLGIDLY